MCPPPHPSCPCPHSPLCLPHRVVKAEIVGLVEPPHHLPLPKVVVPGGQCGWQCRGAIPLDVHIIVCIIFVIVVIIQKWGGGAD